MTPSINRLIARILLLVVATAVAFGVCEIGARQVFPAPPDDSRQPQIVYRYDPEIRYVHLPNQNGWIDDGHVTINAMGFRGPEPVVPKPAGRFRVVIVGDSVAFGWGVNDNQSFGARLEPLLRQRYPDRDLDVVNASVAGYNTHQEVVLLGRNVAKLQPDVVLLGFYSNDVPGALEVMGQSATGGTRIATDTPPTAGQILHLNPSHTSRVDKVLRWSRLLYIAGRTTKNLAHRGETASSGFQTEIEALQGKDTETLRRAWRAVDKEFGDLHTLASDGNFTVGIIVLPCREQVTGAYPEAKYQTRIREMADHYGFFVVDPLDRLVHAPASANDLFIAYDRNHPTAQGHELIAEAIADFAGAHPDILARSSSSAAASLHQ